MPLISERTYRQTDGQTGRHTLTYKQTHTQCYFHTPTPSGAFISQKGWGGKPGFSTPPLFSLPPSLPPSIVSSSLRGDCLNRQPGQTWQTYWKASQNPHANHKPICRETEAFWVWVEIINSLFYAIFTRQMSLHGLCYGGYCPSLLC